jgi:hypothetical protein
MGHKIDCFSNRTTTMYVATDLVVPFPECSHPGARDPYMSWLNVSVDGARTRIEL